MKTLFFLLSFCAFAATTNAQLLIDENMTFYGLDFSKAKLLGGGFTNPEDIKGRYFDSWNGFFRSEDKDYDLGAALKKTVTLDFTNAERNNKAVDAGSLVTNNDYSISAAQAESVVKEYDTKGKSGLGCAFVVESFDKGKAVATVYVVFFDQVTKRIVLNKKMEESPSGFGLKNYWGNAIRLIINDCKKQFPKWVKGK